MSGELNSNFGKSMSDEHKNKIRQHHLKNPLWNRGKKLDEKYITINREAHHKEMKPVERIDINTR